MPSTAESPNIYKGPILRYFINRMYPFHIFYHSSNERIFVISRINGRKDQEISAFEFYHKTEESLTFSKFLDIATRSYTDKISDTTREHFINILTGFAK